MADEIPSSPRIDQLKERLAKDPKSRMFLQLAEEYRRAGALELAAETCRAGLKSHPKYWAARVALARACLGLGKAKEAVSELKKVLAAVPDNILAGKLLGQVYEKVGKSGKALETYQRLLPYDPDDAELATKIAELSAGGGATPAPPAPEAPEPAPPEDAPATEMAEAPPALPAHEDPPALEAAEPPPALDEGTAILEEPPDLGDGPGGYFRGSAVAESAQSMEDTLPPEMTGEVNRMSHDLGQELEQAPVDQAVPDTLDLTPSPDLLPKEIKEEARQEAAQSAPSQDSAPEPVAAEPAEAADAEGEPAEGEDVVSRTMAELLHQQGHVDQAIETLERLMLMDRATKEDEERLAQLLSERGDRLGERYEAVAREEAMRRKLETLRGWLGTIRGM